MKYFFLFICLCIIGNDVFSQAVNKGGRKGRTSAGKKAKKSKTRPKATTAAIDTPAVKPPSVVIRDTVIPPVIVIHDTVNNPILQLDTVQKQMLEGFVNMQKLMEAGFKNADSLKKFKDKLDTALILKLDTIKQQTKPEGFWKGLFKAWFQQWTYEKILGKSEKNDKSGIVIFFTWIALLVRVILICIRIKEYKDGTEKNTLKSKRRFLRLTLSVLSWLMIFYSLASTTKSKEDLYLEEVKKINEEIKNVQKNNNDKIVSSQYALSQITSYITNTTTIVQQINVDTLLKQFDKVMDAQTESGKKQAEILRQQKDSEKNIVANVKNYSTSSLWILFFIILSIAAIIIIIFKEEVRLFVKKKFKI